MKEMKEVMTKEARTEMGKASRMESKSVDKMAGPMAAYSEQRLDTYSV